MPGIWDSAVDVADRDPGADGIGSVGDESCPVQRLGDDRVELARCDGVLQLLRLGRRVEIRVEDRQLRVT
jgi:hypothetical protein